ncbi:MAG: GNAT family N-acetyltransferase [Buchananella hordeovulneris]|nr:GNAT family N-acetyltransferase [Buchananella hordeovulneris]
MAVERVSEYSPELREMFERLIPQLSRSAPAPTEEQIRQMLAQGCLDLFVFRPDAPLEDGTHPLLGTLSLISFQIPTGVRAWIEDVVVDQAARGQGAGAALVAAAVAHAKEMGCRTVDLTSRPSREAANRLYRRCGFATRETNVYRHD